MHAFFVGVPPRLAVTGNARVQSCRLNRRDERLRIYAEHQHQRGRRNGFRATDRRYPVQHHVAIVTRLAMQPDVSLIDELTSALAPERGGEVFELMEQHTLQT